MCASQVTWSEGYFPICFPLAPEFPSAVPPFSPVGLRSTVDGPWSTIHGQQSTVHGPRSTVDGRLSTVHGRRSKVHGLRCTVHGRRSTVHGRRSTVDGPHLTVDGPRSTVDGRWVTVHGPRTTVHGRRAWGGPGPPLLRTWAEKWMGGLAHSAGLNFNNFLKAPFKNKVMGSLRPQPRGVTIRASGRPP